ncbi:MAG: hypothetical protein H6R45_751, partial [Proteobacteria bacterium]|nr:hypothetical protein [Pseudomonadota bacterium]
MRTTARFLCHIFAALLVALVAASALPSFAEEASGVVSPPPPIALAPAPPALPAPLRIEGATVEEQAAAAKAAVDEHDYRKAAPLLLPSCEEDGVAESCYFLGEFYYTGNVFAKDMARAIALYLKACAAGDWRSCNSYGISQGEFVESGEEKSATNAYLELACSHDYGLGCSNLGYRYEKGNYVIRDPERARALYAQSCELQYGGGCYNMASVLEDGIGGEKDLPGALSFYEKGCAFEHLDSCFWAAFFLEKGK